MARKLREKTRGKKGFTLVELIVVIVIILILAAVLVPQLLRYVDRANEAKVRADAATILSQVQADFADYKVDNPNSDDFPGTNYRINGVRVTRDQGNHAAGTARITVRKENQEEYITTLRYNNGTYTAYWEADVPPGIEPWTITRNSR